ncbi:MAG: hypothetical protein JJ974_03255 [Phycisphaerales bacterium]|nr:hypothetical protein [Phycisphaerales bacterium]
MNTLPTKALALIALAGTAATSASAQNINWNNGAGGLWNAPANWTPATVPSMVTETAVFSIGGAYTATLNVTTNGLGSVSIFDPDCTLSTNTGVTLGVQNGIINNGLILINNSNGGFASNFNFNSTGMISGTGTITLNGSGTRSQVVSAGGAVVTNGAGHTINGIGRIIGDFVNDGTISASTPSTLLDVRTGAWTNNNSIEVINGSIMNLVTLDITQSPSGTISVVDGNLNFQNSVVTNGTIQSMPGFNWTANQGTNTFDSVQLTGNGETTTGVLLNLIDTVQNDGTLTINNSNGGFQSAIQFQNPFALNGTGSILLNGVGTRSILFALDPADLVTQASTHTILGQGVIQCTIANNGEIVANFPSTSLLFNSADQVNNNIYRIINDSIMTLNPITVDQTGGGSIQIDEGLLDMNSTTILDGSINSTIGFARLNSGVNAFDSMELNSPLSMNTGTVLEVTDGLINNSTITVNNSNGGFPTPIQFKDSTTLSGTGNTLLNGSGSRAQLNTDIGHTMTIAGDHLVNGFGQINASLINNGQIDSSGSSQTMFLRVNDKVNNNLISIQPDSTINISNITITQDPAAQINVGDGLLTLDTTDIIDGTINASAGSVLLNSGITTYDQVVNNAATSMNTGTVLRIPNGIENNDTIIVNNSNGGFPTSLVFTDSSSISGTGSIVLNGTGSRSQLNSDPGQTGTIDSLQSVRGMGQVNASLINNGLISSEVPNQTMTLQIQNKVNNTLIQIQPTSAITVQNIEIDQSAGGQILNNDGLLTLTGAAIKGGTLDALASGATRVISSAVLEDVVNLAPMSSNSGSSIEVAGTLTNHNTITINNTNGGFATPLTSSAPAMIDGMGDIILNGSTSRSQITGAGLTLGADQTLSGIGQINAPLTHHGTFAPGLSVGVLSASQPITLSDTSTYKVEIASASSNDRIDSTSTYHADGVLNVQLIDGFVPTTSFVTTIVTADGGVTGTFDTLIAPPPPADPRLSYKIGYFEDEIRIGAVCDSDIDFNGEIDFFDISIFLSQFTSMDPAADFNQDGEFDFFDISLFLSLFANGCP